MNLNNETPTPSFEQPPENDYVLHRRFDRMGRLVGDEAMEKLFRSHVMVLGLGGVGSWTAESLARSGVGRLSIADFDEICITNANRQLHALQGLVGRKKAEVMGERLRKINPQAQVNVLPEFYEAESCEKFFALKPDVIVDAIDNMTAKAHLLAQCRARGIKVITSSGAAARLDPLQIRLVDLAETHTDPLAHQLRKILRQKHDFPEGRHFGIPCVFSEEEPMMPVDLHYDKGMGFKCVCPQNAGKPHSCEHRNVIYGTASFVTGTFGLTMASWVVRELIGGQP